MKNRYLLMLVCSFVFTSISAQDFNFGVKGGINIASISGTYIGVSGLGSKVSFHLGGVAEIPISDKFGAQVELLYSSQGTQWSFIGSNSLRLDYVNLPVLAKYNIVKGLSAEAGPLVGFLVATNAEKEDYNSIDVAIAVGASYKLSNKIFFSLRYNRGLTNINKNEVVALNNQNNVLQLSAGYTF